MTTAKLSREPLPAKPSASFISASFRGEPVRSCTVHGVPEALLRSSGINLVRAFSVVVLRLQERATPFAAIDRIFARTFDSNVCIISFAAFQPEGPTLRPTPFWRRSERRAEQRVFCVEACRSTSTVSTRWATVCFWTAPDPRISF